MECNNSRNQVKYTLNYGPHHPSTHGLLHLGLTLKGEEVLSCEPDIGYLHRGVEKIVEGKNFLSHIPYIDRLDYLSPVIQEHAYVLAIEELLGIKVPRRAQLIRIIIDELTRISSHIMGIGCAAYDLGSLSLFVYGFEERERIMDIFRMVTGSRMHLSYYIPGGVVRDISIEALDSISNFINKLTSYMGLVQKLALNNRIFKSRTKSIGVITKDMAISNGISGINLRASGVGYDMRKTRGYAIYNELKFETITLNEGDCYARSMLRFLEIEQSINLIKQCLSIIEPGETKVHSISGSKFYLRNLELPQNSIVYSSVETPRGEFGIHMLVGEDTTKPYRMHFKSPSFATIQLLRTLLVGHKLPDITAILGSLDFVMGCCDR